MNFNLCKMQMILRVVSTFLLIEKYAQGATLNDTKDLVAAIFTGYDKRVRPLKNQSHTVSVSINPNLLGIPDFDEEKETLTTTMYVEVKWKDEYLTWNPLTYSNVYHIKLPESNIWTPDIVHGNSFNKIKQIGDQKRLVTVLYTGEVTWGPGDIFESGCSLDVTYFPYDTQTCKVMLVPWSYWDFEVSLTPAATTVGMGFYDENGAWEVTSSSVFSATTQIQVAEYTPGYTQLFVQLVLKRRSAFYIGTSVLPPAVLVILSIFTFLLPPESGEKVSYCVTMFLSVAVFLTFIADNMPHTSVSISIFIAYLSTTLVFVSIGLICSIAIVRIYLNEDDESIPACLKRLMSPKTKVAPAKSMEDMKKEKEDGKQDELTWKTIAHKIDMVTFIVFLVVTFLLNLVVFCVLSSQG